MKKKRISITIYDSTEQRELLHDFKTELKQLQKEQNTKSSNQFIFTYSNLKQYELLKLLKTIYTLAIENNKINSLTNAINKLISSLQSQINKQ